MKQPQKYSERICKSGDKMVEEMSEINEALGLDSRLDAPTDYTQGAVQEIATILDEIQEEVQANRVDIERILKVLPREKS